MRTRNLDNDPDDVRKFTNAKRKLGNLGDATIVTMTFEPGWK